MNPKLKGRISCEIMASFCLACMGLELNVGGATRTSANYQFTFESTDAGGQEASSPNYAVQTSVGGVGGVSNDAAQGQSLQSGYMGQLAAWVMGRWVFYNQSAWDGNDGAANADDDAAIAPDKSALLPGGVATFANYTSYSRGLNGIMVDIADLPAVPTATDFVFTVGNNNTPSTWPIALATPSISVRWGAGGGGADRVTLIWANNVIQNQWLQLTVLATPNSGLSSPDVFYFGNAIGEVGNSSSDAKVDPTDQLLIRAHPRNVFSPAPIDDPYDINRDKKVDPSDELIARANQTSVFTALKLIDLSGPGMASLKSSGAVGGQRESKVKAQINSALGEEVSQAAPPPEGATEGLERLSIGMVVAGGGTLVIGYVGAPERSYRLETSRTLGTDSWHPVTADTAVLPNGQTYRWVIPIVTNQPQQFYRVVNSR